MRHGSIIVCVSLVLLGIGVVSAEEGRRPIYAAPTVITESGRYILTRNLPPGGDHAIKVEADDVEIDLNGFTVDTTGLNRDAILLSSTTNVTIRNGFLRGGGIGSFPLGASHVFIADVVIDQPYAEGIRLEGVRGVRIHRNTVSGGTTGISVAPVSADTPTGSIVGNTVKGCTSTGIRIVTESQGLVIRDNRVARITGDGIGIDTFEFNGAIEGNLISETAGIGIRLRSSRHGTVRDNNISHATSAGITLDSNSQAFSIVGNSVQRTRSGDGLSLDGADNCVVKRNHFSNNDGTGFWIKTGSGDSHYDGNVSLGNCLAACPCGSANFCDDGVGNTDGGGNTMP